jgi:hypothetical protein
MNEKPVKYELHIRGKSSCFTNTAFKIDISSTTPFPAFRTGDYIGAKCFDFQYEHSDRLVVADVLWDFLEVQGSEVIHQYVTVRDESSGAATERNSRNQESGL